MYKEFTECNSFMYSMPDRENSESISSDGEFNEFKEYDLVDETDDRFTNEQYDRLLKEKYLGQSQGGGAEDSASSRENSKSYQVYRKYLDRKYFDEELQ